MRNDGQNEERLKQRTQPGGGRLLGFVRSTGRLKSLMAKADPQFYMTRFAV
jgi:hypothetical protein